MNWSWLSFVAGLLVGWLIEWLIDFFYWRRRRRTAESANKGLQARLDAARAEQNALEAQLAACREGTAGKDQELAALQARLEASEASLAATRAGQGKLDAQLAAYREGVEAKGGELDALRARLQESEAALAAARAGQAQGASRAQEFALQLAAAQAAIPAEPQDLTRIEGIGPAIARVLNEAGIVNFGQLAGTAAGRLRDILDAAGPRFRIARPATWPQQARLAAEERWDELQALQDSLNAGRTADD